MRWRGYALLQGWWRWRWRRRRGGRGGGHCAILHVDGGRGVTPTEHLSEMAARSLDSRLSGLRDDGLGEASRFEPRLLLLSCARGVHASHANR
eukprot:scaffold46794_cov56-Phaeocystis_antarctica.AAC.3